jgi:serine/threonine protein kinase
VNGGALEQLIQSSEEFSWCLRVRLAHDISRGMQYLHTHGMLHRDLNSKNVLLRMHGSKYTAVVADFGLAAKTIPRAHAIKYVT